jgi:4'-phosphopantetheinyl transferase
MASPSGSVAAPAPGEVHVWILKIALDGPLLASSRTILDAAERERAERLPAEAPRARFVAGRAALRRLAAAYLHQQPEAIRFRYGDRGKPYLEGTSLAVSLSHADAHVLIAAATDGELGADLEAIVPFAGLERMVDHFYTEREGAFVRSATEPERSRRFFAVWTRKEAYLKALGIGLAVTPAALDVLDPAAPNLPDGQGDAKRLRVVDVELGWNLAGALAVPPAIRTITLMKGEP